MHYDFIEIGTSDFDTLIGISNNDTRGLSIEPLKYYLDRLPNRDNVIKVNAAVSDTNGELEIYFISDDKMKENYLPNWVRGCNSIGRPHNFTRNTLGHELYDSLVQIEKVPTINWESIISKYNVGSIDYLKIDTEGFEHIILKDYFKQCNLNPLLYANKILFEYNESSNREELDKIVASLKDYSISYLEQDIMLIRKNIINLDNFDWGWMNNSEEGLYHKNHIIQETFIDGIYEKFFKVEEGDIVLDFGSSVGPFTYSILNRKPMHVYCIEPSELEFPTLVRNTRGYPVTTILKGISDGGDIVNNIYGDNEMDGITFMKLVKFYDLKEIDFLKTDCEGGEYSIFNSENIEFILNNVRKISGEWHLNTTQLKDKFRYFRDNYLSRFEDYEVFSVDGVNIKWNLWNEHFIEYYSEVIIYIKNKKI